MSWMSNYGDLQGKARAIRIIGLISGGFALLVFASYFLISILFQYSLSSVAGFVIVWSVIAIHGLGIALIALGAILKGEAKRRGIKLAISTRAIVFGILMVTSFVWVPLAAIGIGQLIHSFHQPF